MRREAAQSLVGLPRVDKAPTMPPAWLAQFTEAYSNESVTFLMDQDLTLSPKRSGQSVSAKNPRAPRAYVGTPREWQNSTQFHTEDVFCMDINGQRYGEKATAAMGPIDFFSWLPFATFNGTVPCTGQGRTCDSWALSVKGTSLLLLTQKQADGTVRPVQYTQNSSSYGVETLYVTGWWPSKALPIWDDFDPDDYTKPQPPCPLPPGGAIPAPTTQDIYVFHPAADFTIVRQDIGDALGDSIFICDEGMHEPDTNKSLTHWSLEWVPRWGQYQNCDGWGDERSCIGDENFWVGHQAAFMMGAPLAGQCDANPLVGEWWSLPAGGECAPGATPGDGSCTWRATHVKTVASSCLFDARRGFVDECKKQDRSPYTQPTKILQAAFDDLKAGGCPAIPGPPGSARAA